jgi:predicted regulator of Ras-like GTPase activity (Roadblock/LC7/MglB family)
MNSEALANLSKTDGVLGFVVFDDQGACLVNQLPPPFEPILLAEVMRRLSGVFDVFSSLEEGEPSSFSVDCEEGCLVLKRIEGQWVVALTRTDVNMSMLNVAMNVVVLNLSRGSGSGTRPAARITESMTGRSNPSLTISSDGDTAAIPADAVERAIVQQILGIYREFLGPAAKIVFKQQLATLGVTSRTLRRGQVGDFVARLAGRIPVAQRQQEFLAAVRKFQDRVLL